MESFGAETTVIAAILHLRESPYFALHKGIASGFVKAIGSRNKPKRTIFYFWCGDPWYRSIKIRPPICSSFVVGCWIKPKAYVADTRNRTARKVVPALR